MLAVNSPLLMPTPKLETMKYKLKTTEKPEPLRLERAPNGGVVGDLAPGLRPHVRRAR
jgi:hypothetical protein